MNIFSHNADTGASMNMMGKFARESTTELRTASSEQKNTALLEAARAIVENTDGILSANANDVESARKTNLSPALIDRLTLDRSRVTAMSNSLHDIAALPDPVGQIIRTTKRPNGLKIEQVRTPIGVIAIIYESRPNVTIDASALCLKSGNASILRCGSQALETSKSLFKTVQEGIAAANLPENCVQLVPTSDREAVGALLSGLDGAIDLIIPRGGKSLVARVKKDARAPVLSHLDGNCHVYVDGDANIEKALKITMNSKMRRTAICGAAETLLIDKSGIDRLLPKLVERLLASGCQLKVDSTIQERYPNLEAASEKDFYTEFLDSILSVAIVDGVDGAIRHIALHTSGHTEAIVTENCATAEHFLESVDSAIVMHNASTQFADGGEFGLGAEIGIATGRLHARGPVGLEELTTYKNVVRGTGHIRA